MMGCEACATALLIKKISGKRQRPTLNAATPASPRYDMKT